jgi:hypothetical protein
MRPHDQVFTCGGDSFGEACKFPFEWERSTYHGCTTDHSEEGGRPWCITNTATEEYGYCDCKAEHNDFGYQVLREPIPGLTDPERDAWLDAWFHDTVSET